MATGDPDGRWVATVKGIAQRPTQHETLWRSGDETPDKLFAGGLAPQGTDFDLEDHQRSRSGPDDAFKGAAIGLIRKVGTKDSSGFSGPFLHSGKYCYPLVGAYGVPGEAAGIDEAEVAVHRVSPGKIPFVIKMAESDDSHHQIIMNPNSTVSPEKMAELLGNLRSMAGFLAWLGQKPIRFPPVETASER